ncbi:PDZ domain-containing protein [Drechslerella dactyloides]|uniref:PDZ domain-containing protein n=1 Tax=Drechslerella dactyloides TaxID=74499 RepID=A0AAD6ITC2_DREDA|nr:PDZ domain-containing protein [Drechslerella dactyloides]
MCIRLGENSGGAPVIDQNGKVVAITSSLTASDDDQMLLLPLHSVAQAIRLIEQNRYVPRGSIQLELGYRKYAEAATYLVPQSFIDRAKAEDTEYSPMAFLTASSVLKGGSSHKAGIRTGDFIIDCNGSILKTYLELQNCLDAFIGGQITLGVVRDGQRLDISVHVQDIREIESREIYQFNQAVFHRIPYRVGLDHDIPLNSGVYISSKFGHISPGQILTKLAHFSIRSVRDAFEAIHNVPHGTLVNATYFGYDRQPATTQIRIYNKNIPEVYSVLIWSPKAPLAASTEDLDWSGQPDPSSLAHQMQLLSVTKAEEAQGRDVWRSSHVKVNVYSPLSTAAEVTMPGVFLQGGPLPTIVTTKFAGYSTMASVTITCGNKTIPAKIKGFRGLFMLVQCSAGDLPPETKPLSFGMDSCPLKVGETYTLHSFEVSNSNSTWLELPTVRQHNFGELVAVDLSEAKISQEANGTGTNSTGDTQTEATIQHILQTINVSEARELGMNAPTLSNIKENHRDNGETLRPVIVGPAFKGHPPSGLQEGDIVHSINGKPIFRLSDVKGLLGTNSTATASISRHRRDLEVSIALFPSRFKPLTRCLFFYGSAITPLDAGVTDSAGVVEACRIEWVKPGYGQTPTILQ